MEKQLEGIQGSMAIQSKILLAPWLLGFKPPDVDVEDLPLGSWSVVFFSGLPSKWMGNPVEWA